MGTNGLAALSGVVVKGFEVKDDASEVILVLEDGRRVYLTLEGDCCSTSHFTDPKQFQDLVGTTIHTVEDREGQSHNNLPEPEGACSISWHFLVFTTSAGHVTIDWHNDSNGYYDGSLSVYIEEGGTK